MRPLIAIAALALLGAPATAQSTTDQLLQEFETGTVSADCENNVLIAFKQHLLYARPGEPMQRIARRHLAAEREALLKSAAVRANARTPEKVQLFIDYWSAELPDPNTNLKFYRTRDFTGCEGGVS